MSEIKKVVLAYSGGLDTSVIIPWLKEHYDNCEVIAVCGNVGQDDELDDLKQRAVASGASKLYVEDLTDEFVNEFVIPTMQAGADYEGYLLGTSLARPILAKGNIINSGVWSPYSLYSEDIVTFNEGEGYQQSDATGFIRLLGLPTRIQASVNARNRREAEKC